MYYLKNYYEKKRKIPNPSKEAFHQNCQYITEENTHIYESHNVFAYIFSSGNRDMCTESKSMFLAKLS